MEKRYNKHTYYHSNIFYLPVSHIKKKNYENHKGKNKLKQNKYSKCKINRKKIMGYKNVRTSKMVSGMGDCDHFFPGCLTHNVVVNQYI